MSDNNKIKVLIDADPSMFTGGLDIDDDLAIAVLNNSPQVEIVGITTTYGNAPLNKTYADALKLVEMLKMKVPVLKGADWDKTDIKCETDASRFIAESAASYPGELHIVTLGPLTNLAAAIYHSPTLPKQVKSLMMMGGRLKTTLSLPWKELNFKVHPEAVNMVLDAPMPKTVFSTELCAQVVVRKKLVQKWAENSNFVFARHLDKIERFRSFNQKVDYLFHPTAPKGGFHPWDVITVSYLLKPEIFSGIINARMSLTKMSVNLPGVMGLGRFIFEANSSNPNVYAPTTIDVPAFLRLMTEMLTINKEMELTSHNIPYVKG